MHFELSAGTGGDEMIKILEFAKEMKSYAVPCPLAYLVLLWKQLGT
jgi:hypothetical protein